MDPKRVAAEKSVQYIREGMTLGLGTGSTVYWAIQEIGRLVQDGMRLRGIPTSRQTEELAQKWKIPLVSFDEVEQIDLTIDGADEITAERYAVKGGGGALLREKLVARASKKVVYVVDRSKWVTQLGSRPLPVEVVPFAWQTTAKRISHQLGCSPKLRTVEGAPFQTDNGNYILDCQFESIKNPLSLEKEIKNILGVIESGLFLGIADVVVIGDANGTAKVIESTSRR